MASQESVDLSAEEFLYLQVGEDPRLLFLHALGRSALDWLQVIEARPDWRCLALDQRVQGHSVYTDEYRFELLEQDFREFVDALHLATFSLVSSREYLQSRAAYGAANLECNACGEVPDDPSSPDAYREYLIQSRPVIHSGHVRGACYQVATSNLED